MTNKLYNKIFKLLKQNIIFVIIFMIIFLMSIIKLPYIIEGVGGVTNLNNRFIIQDEYKSKGSFNMSYVLDYKPNVITYLYALVNPNIDIEKEKHLSEDLEYMYFMKMNEAVDNAIMVAYKKALLNVDIINEELYVTYVYNPDTELKIKDRILKIDGIEVHNTNDVKNIITSKDNAIVTVLNNNKILDRYTKIMNIDGIKYLGVTTSTKYEYKLEKELEFIYDKKESGSSGGLMLSLAIYNKLISTDLTKGYKIAGTGTIDKLGNVGSIGGVKYKVLGSIKNKVDIFFVPEENYEEAIKYGNNKMKIVKINTFDDAIKYLNSI